MSCNCIGNVYTNDNGESVPLTEYMCFDIIANNPFCCDNFNSSCLDRIYFDSTASTYIGCHNCPSSDAKCCQKIQTEANKLNPDKNSKCCENFDSFCVEAYETLKNSSGNFCSDRTDLVNFYKEVYSTDYRPCGFDDEKAEQCIQDLKCHEYDSEECKDKIYQKIQDYNSPCHCTCLKQAGYIDSCMLHVIHKEPTCCHSWTAECDQIKEELSKTFGNPCTIATQDPNAIALLVGADPGTPDTVINCGCTIKGLPTFDDVPCCFKTYCEELNIAYDGIITFNCNDLGVFLNQVVDTTIPGYTPAVTDCQPTDYPLAGGPLCPNANCNDCAVYLPSNPSGWISGFDDEECPGTACPLWPWGAIEGCNVRGEDATDSILGTPPRNPPVLGPVYPVFHNHNSCALSYATSIYSYGCGDIFASVEELQDFILNLAKRFANPNQEIAVQATNCTECCSICRYFGKEATNCSGCDFNFSFTPETPDSNSNDYLVYEGQGITFTVYGISTNYLYYELINSPNQNFINKDDISPSGFGFNNKPLGMTGLLRAVGDTVKFNLKFASDGVSEGPEFFRVKLIEQSQTDGCAYATFVSNPFEVRETATYSLSGVPVNCQVNEGQTLTLQINTTNDPSGTIYYRIVPVGASNITSADFGIPLEGPKSIVNSVMTLAIPITADLSTESAEERFEVDFSKTSDFATTIARTNTQCSGGIKINDTSTTPLAVSVSVSPTTVNEGGIVEFTVTSNQNGTFYYKIDPNGTNFSSADLDSNTNPSANTNFEDSFTITNGSATTNGFAIIYKKIRADFTTESTESFKLEIRSISSTGPIVATSQVVNVTDSSGTPSYSISGPTTTVEGQSYQYNIVTTNSLYSTLWYRIVPVGNSNITSADFGISLSGLFTLVSGNYNLLVPIASDTALEEQEQFRIELWPSSDFSNVANRLASTNTINLNDLTESITVTPDITTVKESNSVTFTVNTVNITDTSLNYEIVPTSGSILANDFSPPGLTGSFNLTGTTTKTGSFTLTLANNISYEGQEKFVVRIKKSNGTVLATSPEITVQDADPTYEILEDTSTVIEGDSFTVTVNTTNYPNPNVYYRIVPVGTPAVDASDFENFSGAISISPTSSSVTHTIETINKSVYSGTRGFKVIISDAPGGTEKASTGTIQLVDAAPTYAITVPSSVQEGNSFQFTVDTTNLPNNTTRYYKINGTSGTVNASDFSSGLTGSFVVTGNTKTVTIQTVNNSAYEGTEQFTIQIFDDILLTLPAKTESTTINLLEGTPVYGPLSPNNGNITEGNTQSFSFTTANVANGTTLKYKIVPQTPNVNADDFSPASLTGSFTVGSSFSITLANNIAAEPNETFKIQILTQSDDLVYTSNVFNIVDGEAKYVISANKNSVQEGDDVTFTVNTENVANGTNLIYSLSGSVNASDFVPVGITGPIVINNNTYQFVLGISADLSSEGTETFTAVVKNDAGSELSNPTSTITISDTSTSFFTITPSSGTIVEGASQTFTVTRTGAGSDGIFYYGITGIKGGSEINEDDFLDGLTGQFTLTSGVGTFQITTLEDTGASNRQFIVVVGTSTDPYTSVIAETNLFTITDLNPEYNLTQSKTTITEGAEGVTFTLQTTNVPAGTSINYTITSNLGSITQSDFTDNKLSGTITVDSSGYAILYKEARNNCQFEDDVFTVTFKNGTSTVAVSQQTTILNATPEFTSISPFGCINGCGCVEGNLQEGSTNSFTVTGCNIPNGSSSYRAVLSKYNTASGSGFASSDVSSTSILLNFNNNTATFDVNILASGTNTLYEPNDTFVIKILPQSASSPEYFTSGCFTIIDAQPTGTVTPNVSSVSEGETITFNVSIQNVPNGSSIQYEITGIQADDLTDGQLTGNITVTQSGNNYVGSVTKTISTDFDAEDENLTFTIKYNSVVLHDVTIPILDSSQPPNYDFSINRQVLVSLSALKATLTPQNTPPDTVFRMKLLPNIGTTDVPDNAFQDKNGNPLATSLDFTYDGSTPIEAVWILNTLEVFQFRIHVFYVGSGLVSGQETEIKISDVCYSFGDPSINEVVFTCPGSILCGVQQDGTLSGDQDGPGEIKDCESDNCELEYILYECGCSCSEYGGTQTCTICKPKCLDNTVPSGEILCLNCEWIYYEPQPTTCPDGSAGYCIQKGAAGVDCPEACSTDTPPGVCVCAGCDQNPGYTTYTSTPEVFLAIYHDPFVRQAKADSAEDPCYDFCDAQYGGCSTCSQDSFPCMWGAGGCECSPGEEVCFCFRAKSHGYVSYSRFVTRKFRYDPDGFDNTSILVTDEEKVRYRGNTIRVNSRIGQDNCRSCCNSSLCGGGGDTEKGMAVGCVIKTDDPFFHVNNCYGRNFVPGVFPGELITDTIRDSAIVYQSNIFAGIESKYLGYLDDPEDTEALIQTPQAEFYGSECVTETQITKCETQGYIYGKPFPEEGIPGLSGVSALFDAPHKYDLFTSECCEMLSSCTSTQGGGACSTSFDNNCSDFMTNSCFEKANTYCIHSGCDLLQDQNRSKEPFVFYYQGINPEDNPDSPYNLTDCFKIYGLTLKGDVGDPIFYGGTFIDTFSYPPFLRYTIPGSGSVPPIPLRSTNPPQYSGTCLNKSGDTQFEAIKFISEISQPGNPSRTEVIKYLKNVIRLDISDLVTDCFCSKMDYVTPPNTGYNPHPYASEEFSANGGRPLSCRYASIIEASIENITSDGSQLPVPFDALKGEAIPECGVIFSPFWPPQYQFGIVDSSGTVCTSDPETYSNSFNLINYKATNNLFPIDTIAIYNVNSADIINPSTGQLQDNIFRNPCNPCGSFFSPFYYNYDPGSQSTSGGFYINYDAGKNFEPSIEFLSFSAYNYYGTPEEGAFAKIAYSRTLAQQIAAGRIYNHLVCQFIQAVLFAGIEVLHITEPDKGIYDSIEQLTEPAERLEVAQLYNDGPGFPPSVGQLGRYPIGLGLPLDTTNMRYPNGDSVRLSTEDKFGVCGLSVTPFNINIGISRKMIPTNKLNLPNCSIKVYDKDDNEVDCNGINEIIMGGRCFSGPVISKEVWERMKVKWPFVYGYTPTGSFGEWVNSVPNFDVVDPQSGLTIRQQFYIILKASLYDLPSGPAPYVNEEIVHSDEERYLEFDINAKENPYITLEDLRSRIPFEACYDIPVAPTSDTLPCFSIIDSLFGAEGGSFEQLLNTVAILAGCGLGPSDPICQANTTSCISAMVNLINLFAEGCINQTQLGNILQQFCDADPKNNPCFFKYNNKIYREKQL